MILTYRTLRATGGTLIRCRHCNHTMRLNAGDALTVIRMSSSSFTLMTNWHPHEVIHDCAAIHYWICPACGTGEHLFEQRRRGRAPVKRCGACRNLGVLTKAKPTS